MEVQFNLISIRFGWNALYVFKKRKKKETGKKEIRRSHERIFKDADPIPARALFSTLFPRNDDRDGPMETRLS